MPKYLIVLIVMMFITPVISCTQQAEQKTAAMGFLREIDDIYDSLDAKGNPFDGYMQQMMRLAKACKHLKIGDGQVDSLRRLYETYQQAYVDDLTKLNGMQEFDSSFSFIRLHQAILTCNRQSWAGTVSTWLKLFRAGYDRIDGHDSSIISATAPIMRKANARADSLQALANIQGKAFGEKYGFEFVAGRK